MNSVLFCADRNDGGGGGIVRCRVGRVPGNRDGVGTHVVLRIF